MPDLQIVTVSILNWNSAEVTIEAVRSVLALELPDQVVVDLIVLDNGSCASDATLLESKLSGLPVRLLREKQNLGFAAGHNIVIKEAFKSGAEYIWLLNSDALASPTSLHHVLDLMRAQPRCGVVSPVIVRLGQPAVIDFAGAFHDWNLLDSPRPLDLRTAEQLAESHGQALWVVGTAMMLRASALRQVGLLDEQYFAYYEDDDICVRMARAGWHSAMAYGAQVEHACFSGQMFDRPAYYFYLMARNAFRFWTQHTPAPRRRWLHLRLLDTWLFKSNGLDAAGLTAKRDACLLGIWDGMLGRGGPPTTAGRKIPWVMKALRLLRSASHRRHLEQAKI